MNLRRFIISAAVVAIAAVPRAATAQCESKLLPSDGAGSDFAGQALDLSGDFAVVGSASHDHEDGLGNIGGVWIFRWTGAAWVEEQELLAPDRESGLGDNFGGAVSIHGDVAMIGTKYDDEGEDWTGAVYVYRRDGESWTYEQKLKASDTHRLHRFGSSIDLEGDRVVIGAVGARTGGTDIGAAYVFGWDGAAWVQEQRLIPSDGHRQALFGYAVGLHGDAIVVGTPHDGAHAPNGGAAYVYRWNGVTWGGEQKLTNTVPAYTDEFGEAVAVHGDVVVVGCLLDDDLGADSGSAFVYRWNGGAWLLEQKLLASDGFGFDHFGCDVTIEGDDIVVGAHSDDDLGRNCGTVFVFRREDDTWTETRKVHASDAGTDDGLGYAVALSGRRVLAGAPHDDDNGGAAGAAYVFDLEDCACTEDLDGSGVVDFGDVLAVLAAWGNLGGPEDLDGSGVVDFGDLLLILAAWGSC